LELGPVSGRRHGGGGQAGADGVVLLLKMNFRSRLKEPKALLGVGLIFLILASLALMASRNFSVPHSDGATGFLYGVAIGCLLLSIRRRKMVGSK
jgi:hypothetical protein